MAGFLLKRGRAAFANNTKIIMGECIVTSRST